MTYLSSKQTLSFNKEQVEFNKSVVETFDRTRGTLENLVNSINNLQTQIDELKKETKDFDVFDYEEKIAELEMACDSSDHALEEEISPNSNYCYSYLDLYEDELVKKFRDEQYV